MTHLRIPVTGLLATLLAAVALGSVFQRSSWFLPAAFGALLVVAASEGARRLRVPPPLVLVVGVAVLWVYATMRYAGDVALWHVLPNGKSLTQLQNLAADGRIDIDRYAAPVFPSQGIELLTVIGVGMVAALVDAFAVGLRRAALAGLPLLALYTVPATVAPNGVSVPAFVVGAGGYLALLLAESRERVGRWGRSMRYSTAREDWSAPADTSPLAATGRRVGAAVLGVAVLVPLIVPGIEHGLLGGAGNGIGGRGGNGNQGVTVVNPIIDLGSDLRFGKNRTVLRYRGSDTYLRMVALDDFDGRTWAPEPVTAKKDQRVDKGLPLPPGMSTAAGDQRTYRIEVVNLEEQWLPLPYPAANVDIGGTWLYDTTTFNVFSPDTSSQGRKYTATVRDVDVSAEVLRTAGAAAQPLVDRDTALPPDMPASVQQLAEQVTKGTKTAYDKAVALQAWFRDPSQFTYTTRAPDSNGSNAIAQFLDRRSGYCVHFASAMAIMARTLGIPARVAVGFTGGRTIADGRHEVRVHDAHAWPELYFEGVGWVAFEPTPAVRTGAEPAYTAPQAGSNGPNGPAGGPSTAPTTPLTQNKNNQLTTRENDQRRNPNPAVFAQPQHPFPWLPTSLGVIAALMLVAPWVTRKIVRRQRFRRIGSPVAAAGAAWAELEDLLDDHGYAWRESDTPRRGAARLVKAIGLYGPPAAALVRIARVVERVRYAPDPGAAEDLRNDLRELSSGLLAAATPWRRVRARVFPRSTRRVFGWVGERVADVLDGIDGALAGARRRLLPRRVH